MESKQMGMANIKMFNMLLFDFCISSETFTISMVVKSMPKNIGRRKTFRSTDFFRNETNFYQHIWPTFLQFQQKKQIKNEFNDIPKLVLLLFINIEILTDIDNNSYVD